MRWLSQDGRLITHKVGRTARTVDCLAIDGCLWDQPASSFPVAARLAWVDSLTNSSRCVLYVRLGLTRERASWSARTRARPRPRRRLTSQFRYSSSGFCLEDTSRRVFELPSARADWFIAEVLARLTSSWRIEFSSFAKTQLVTASSLYQWNAIGIFHWLDGKLKGA